MQATGNNPYQSYSLSIRLHADGFSFYGYNPNETEAIKEEAHRYTDTESRTETLRRALAGSPLTAAGSYCMGVYGLVTGPSIQVPLEAFRKEEAGTLFRLTYAREHSGKIYYNILPHLEIAEVFSLDKETEALLCHHLPGIRFYHAESMLLEKLLPFDTPGKQRLFVYFHEQEMLVFCYRDQKLLYANTFPAGQTDNAVYFILSVWKKLSLDVREGECILLGESEQKAGCADMLGKYLHIVKPLSAADIYRRFAPARHPHLPFDLLALLINVV